MLTTSCINTCSPSRVVSPYLDTHHQLGSCNWCREVSGITWSMLKSGIVPRLRVPRKGVVVFLSYSATQRIIDLPAVRWGRRPARVESQSTTTLQLFMNIYHEATVQSELKPERDSPHSSTLLKSSQSPSAKKSGTHGDSLVLFIEDADIRTGMTSMSSMQDASGSTHAKSPNVQSYFCPLVQVHSQQSPPSYPDTRTAQCGNVGRHKTAGRIVTQDNKMLLRSRLDKIATPQVGKSRFYANVNAHVIWYVQTL